MKMKADKALKLWGLLAAGMVIAGLAIYSAVGYVAHHFIMKYW